MRSFARSVLLAAILTRAYAAVGPTAELTVINTNIAPDGFTRSAALVDGTFPGPLINGNKGDTFSLNVFNGLTDTTLDLVTSIHWHGIFQTHTNYVDGAAFVNQCPIIPLESFNYVFNSGEQTGTYWYHSHYKAQYCDGVRGALVIYDPNDPQAPLYDVDNEETVVTLADWYHYVSTEAPLVPVFNSTLINGLGRYPGGPQAPLAVVNVVPGQRYRLRLVSISCDPGYDFSIDSHQLTVIEVDGNNVQPLLVDSLEIFAGQRYSVVLNANQPVDNYWIRALPNFQGQSFNGFTNLAILRYAGAPAQDPSNDPTVNIPTSLLPLNETDLHPLVPTPVPGNPVPGGADININLNVTLSDDFTQFLVNGVSFDGPEIPVLLQILNGANASELVPAGSIYPLGANMSVELSIPAGVPGGPHPVHLHGHSFHVVRSAGNSTYNYDDPVIRDVVSIGDTGDDVTIRFFTDNPGPWFFHCHIDWHLEKGFAVVFAEDVPEVSSTVFPTAQWDGLCPAYDQFVGLNTTSSK
ncbi:laccase [Russula earlei]|uniref:Laccase n=1 Tax=Russula earlei TaxID=71964 RepID=A0ACC0UHM5_9AGAM|nr:laccase [Russula earlei]